MLPAVPHLPPACIRASREHAITSLLVLPYAPLEDGTGVERVAYNWSRYRRRGAASAAVQNVGVLKCKGMGLGVAEGPVRSGNRSQSFIRKKGKPSEADGVLVELAREIKWVH